MARKKKEEKKDEQPVIEKVDSRAIDSERTGEEIENWAEDMSSDAYIDACKLYPKIQQCYTNKQQQSDWIEEYWNIYNARPDENQQYTGNSQCYIPAVRDAVNARCKRTLATLFPANYKHVDAVGPADVTPYPTLALLEHYIRRTNLKDIVRTDLLSGDVTGQWVLYIDWLRTTRRVTELVKKPPVVEIDLGEETDDVEDVTVEMEWDVEDKTVVEEMPDVTPMAVDDLAVYPPTVNDIERATATAVRLRLSKESVQQFIDEGVFVGWNAKEIMDNLNEPDGGRQKRVPQKRRTADAGVRTEGTYKYALIYEVHTDLELEEGKGKEPCFVYYAGPEIILGIIRNPFWPKKRPVITAPVERIQGTIYGISRVEPVKYLQWNLNDYWNMGQDSAQYALLPIVMTDPLANPNYQSMVMGLAAVWLTDPQKTQFAQFPAIYKDAVALCQAIKAQINESMEVNDAMLGKAPAGRKNQAQAAAMAQEQQSNIIDHAKRYEQCILNPLLERMFELDRQFRTKELTVITMGEVGARAKQEEIPVQAFNERYFFRWCGTAYQAGLQRMQQMIAWMNVLRGIPPQQLDGRRLNVGPILEYGTEQIFGPELGPRILIDERNLYHVDPEDENLMMHNGMPANVHPADDDQRHLAAHMRGATLTGDPHGLFRAHIQAHQQAMQQKMMKNQPPQPGQQGIPGGAGPGVAGTPRPGAIPGQPRPQGPAGMIHPDQVQDAQMGPR
jgi:hypothetical protein